MRLVESTDPERSPLASAEERAKILEMRAALESDFSGGRVAPFEDVVGDIRLLRFLRGYTGDVDAAVAAYRTMLAWRLSNNMDQRRPFLEESNIDDLNALPLMEDISVFFPMIPFAGYSMPHGSPVTIDCAGLVDVSAVSLFPESDFENYFFAFLEKRSILLDKMSRQAGFLVKAVQIRDYRGFGLHHLSSPKGISLMQRFVKESLQNYPESMGKLYFINVPAAFAVAFKLIRPLINDRTFEKFRFVTEGDNGAIRALLPRMDTQVLEKLDDVHQRGIQILDRPQSNVPIPRGTKIEVPVYLEAPGTRVSWNWRVSALDIGFSVAVFQCNSGSADGDSGIMECGSTWVVEPDRVIANQGAITGSYVSEAGGEELLICWDNSYSFIRSKMVVCTVERHRAD